ncbi:tyrosine-type recombinase/integrase [Streptomyces pristinaespiralis]|uniref:tyrosine-type recombinase/integrase n=1 Tax=Streptomyces pristinaespiralis TaxID=38300 RepID=UPI0038326EE5
MPRGITSSTARTTRRDLPPPEALAARFDGNVEPIAAVAARPALPQPHGNLAAAGQDQLVQAVDRLTAGMSSGTRCKQRQGVRMITDLLTAHPGATWQERWLVSGMDAEGPAPVLPGIKEWTRPGGGSVHRGLTYLMALRAVQPSVAALRRHELPQMAEIFLNAQNDPAIETCLKGIEATHYDGFHQRRARYDLAAALITQRIPLSHLTPEALMFYAQEWKRVCTVDYDKNRFGARVLWEVLCQVGHFPAGTPATLRRAMIGTRRDVAALVRSYGLANKSVEAVLIDYLHVRVAEGLDFSSTTSLARKLASLFWKAVETVNPGQADLRLSPATYETWKQRMRVKEDGSTRIDFDNLLLAVKAFYLDLTAWAAAEPERWGPWVAPCPVPRSDLRGYGKRIRRRRELMHDRVRELQPLLGVLVEHVDAELGKAAQLLAAAAAAGRGERFEHSDTLYTRVWTRHDDNMLQMGVTTVRVRAGGGDAVNLVAMEEDAFWTWAVVHTLRLSGVRMEELLELTHLSIRQYQRPSGEVIGLLVIAPSKTDRERVIPMSAELFHVIAQIIRRLTADRRAIRLLRRWDQAEKLLSEPMPFLFQRRHNSTCGMLNENTVMRLLRKACNRIGQHDPRFADLAFTAHDFRRLFATDLVNNGVPIHIGAALLGHLSLQTTSGYVAVFNDEVVRHYQQFLDNRRRLRPDGEYRTPTCTEWGEFEEHFDTRKVELGTCGRPYASDCRHEHACIRCPVLRVNPQMAFRLEEIETDLIARRARAEAEGWLGEIEGIDLTLRLLRQKQVEAERLAGMPRTVDLGIPVVAPRGSQ